MTLMDYCMQYIGEIMDGKRAAPEGVTLTETDPMRRSLELMQKAGDIPTLVRMCAAQDGTEIPQEVFDSFDPESLTQLAGEGAAAGPGRRKARLPGTAGLRGPGRRPGAVSDPGAAGPGLGGVLQAVPDHHENGPGPGGISVLAGQQGALGRRRGAGLRRGDGRLPGAPAAGGAALLSGDQKTFETFRCEAPELVHLPQATYEWYCRNYLDRDYPFRMLLRCNGVTFPDRKEA